MARAADLRIAARVIFLPRPRAVASLFGHDAARTLDGSGVGGRSIVRVESDQGVAIKRDDCGCCNLRLLNL